MNVSNGSSSLLGYQEIAAKQNEVSFGEAASRIVVNDGKIEGQSFFGRVWASLTKSSDKIKEENVAAKDAFVTAIRSAHGNDVAERVKSSLAALGEERALTSSDIKNGLKEAEAYSAVTAKQVFKPIGDRIDKALNDALSQQQVNIDIGAYRTDADARKFFTKSVNSQGETKLLLNRKAVNDLIEEKIREGKSVDSAVNEIFAGDPDNFKSPCLNNILNNILDPVKNRNQFVEELKETFNTIKEKELTKELTSKEVKIKGLNEASWKPIKTTIKKDGADGSGLKSDYDSTITPASNLSCLKKSYEADGIGGVCSKDERNASHTINGAVDKLEVAGEDGQPKQILQVVRSGVLTSAKIKDKNDHTTAANKRFDENLLMALDAKGLLPGPRKAGKGTRETPVNLSIADIGLLSKNVIKGKEENMQDDQFNFLEGANNQPREIRYTDQAGQEKTIWVKPEILAFNFGVQVSDRIQGQSKLTKQNNEASLNDLLGADENSEGMVKAFLKSPEGLALSYNDRKAISDLASQCREMRKNGEMYSYNDGDIYAFPARLTVLCDKIGIMPMIHCKSGKDRTSRLAEEAKFLAAEIHESTFDDDEGNMRLSERETISVVGPKASGRVSPRSITEIQDNSAVPQVPQKGRITDAKRTKAFIAFSSKSGNAKIQELNTGKPGNMQSWSYLQRMRSNISDHMTVLPVIGKYFRDDTAKAYAGKSESVET